VFAGHRSSVGCSQGIVCQRVTFVRELRQGVTFVFASYHHGHSSVWCLLGVVCLSGSYLCQRVASGSYLCVCWMSLWHCVCWLTVLFVSYSRKGGRMRTEVVLAGCLFVCLRWQGENSCVVKIMCE
jgi:hypothetical protein